MIEKRLLELGIQLPEDTPPKAMYIPIKQVGNLLFASGQIPTRDGKLIDHYDLSAPGGGSVSVCVFERYYFRVGNYLTLTVTADDFTGRTRVRCVAGGGSSSALVNFDRGAADAYESAARDVLRPHFCKET